MTAEIYIIAGFLGAGKTTLIQKLLKEAFQKDKVVLIENDFGEISVDAALLKSGGVAVKEINSGCICCSLSGDFVKAVQEILERFHPDTIIIEPSGVGKLSDIVKACADPRIRPRAEVKAKITVADVKRCKMYLDNFGEFFADQIRNADAILLSRTEEFPDRIEAARRLIKNLNSRSPVFVQPWARLGAAELLFPRPDRHQHPAHRSTAQGGGYSAIPHDLSGDAAQGNCDHAHVAGDFFDTVTIRTHRQFTAEDLQACIYQLEHHLSGTVLRVKGILRGTDGYVNLQYVPQDLKITHCTAAGGMVSIIGRNLNRRELVGLFNGE